MIGFYRSLFIFMSFFGVQTPLLAQEVAIEKTNQGDLQFRGQGPNPWCFAFAEEQVIKDALCSGASCERNASQIEISLFDIIKAHNQWEEEKAKLAQSIIVNGGSYGYKLVSGSGNFFVFPKVKQTSVRASSCTLEKELFRWNRSAAFNPEKVSLLTQLQNFSAWAGLGKWDLAADNMRAKIQEFKSSRDYKKASATDKEISVKSMQAYADHLDKVATTVRQQKQEKFYDTLYSLSQTRWSFLDAVLEYSKCENRIDVSGLSAKQILLDDSAEIQNKLRSLLAQDKSVSLGVCAEVLEDETDRDEQSCSSHAVAAKKFRQVGNQAEILIVDSAFFSNRARTQDGAIWIPESVVVLAVERFGKRMNKAQADLAAELEAFKQANQKELEAEAGKHARISLMSLSPRSQKSERKSNVDFLN